MSDKADSIIQLAPGLTLVVNAEHVDDDVTSRLVDRVKELFDRQQKIERIHEVIDQLVRQEDQDGLHQLVELTGWMDNRQTFSFEWIARGLKALVEAADLDDVIDLFETAEFVGAGRHRVIWGAPASEAQPEGGAS